MSNLNESLKTLTPNPLSKGLHDSLLHKQIEEMTAAEVEDQCRILRDAYRALHRRNLELESQLRVMLSETNGAPASTLESLGAMQLALASLTQQQPYELLRTGQQVSATLTLVATDRDAQFARATRFGEELAKLRQLIDRLHEGLGRPSIAMQRGEWFPSALVDFVIQQLNPPQIPKPTPIPDDVVNRAAAALQEGADEHGPGN